MNSECERESTLIVIAKVVEAMHVRCSCQLYMFTHCIKVRASEEDELSPVFDSDEDEDDELFEINDEQVNNKTIKPNALRLGSNNSNTEEEAVALKTDNDDEENDDAVSEDSEGIISTETVNPSAMGLFTHLASSMLHRRDVDPAVIHPAYVGVTGRASSINHSTTHNSTPVLYGTHWYVFMSMKCRDDAIQSPGHTNQPHSMLK